MKKVYVVFKREILSHEEWRDEVVDVYANKDNALNVCRNSNLLWFCEYDIKY